MCDSLSSSFNNGIQEITQANEIFLIILRYRILQVFVEGFCRTTEISKLFILQIIPVKKNTA